MGHSNVEADAESDISGPKTLFPVSDLEKGIVGWDDQTDLSNPRNFATTKKWIIFILLSCMIVLSFLASSIIAPAASFIDAEFHNESSTLSSLITTIYVLGFMVGPLLLSPLSELYGRRPVYNCANVFFTLTHIGAALAPNIGQLLAFRLLSGLGASACLSIGGGVLADLFDLHERGVPNAVLTLGSMFGPVLGPLIGGIITEKVGWRWIFRVLLIACAAVTIFMFVLPETNAPVLLQRKTQRLRDELNRPELQSAYDADKEPTKSRALIARAVLRPWLLLFRSPLLPLLCLEVGFISGLLYLLLTTTSTFFRTVYGWSLSTAGLAYLGLGAGSLLGLVLFAQTSDAVVARLAAANGNAHRPEMRLATAFVPALFIPVTFFWYGWSTCARAHWAVAVLSLAPFGFAQVGLNAAAQAYLIDASGPYAASSYACVTAVRCVFGAVMPLAGPSLYQNLGLGWGNSLLGLVSLAMVPFPVLIYRYGAKLREKYPLDQA
ncbi:major facilitator superfamily transporter [Neofusicoccum parvum]|uniref:Major facilitator superfamily transporter n=1 Tax=Neofusicoccum parvum TaxID=310453 RepID=A0ACB5SBS4_9PEZI|nr:major facilitator superfamily transporter [Neofusicoccum parvum]